MCDLLTLNLKYAVVLRTSIFHEKLCFFFSDILILHQIHFHAILVCETPYRILFSAGSS